MHPCTSPFCMDFLGSGACAKVGDFFASKCIDFRWQALSPAAAEMDCDEIGYDTNVYGFKKKIISQHHMTKVVLVSACVKKKHVSTSPDGLLQFCSTGAYDIVLEAKSASYHFEAKKKAHCIG